VWKKVGQKIEVDFNNLEYWRSFLKIANKTTVWEFCCPIRTSIRSVRSNVASIRLCARGWFINVCDNTIKWLWRYSFRIVQKFEGNLCFVSDVIILFLPQRIHTSFPRCRRHAVRFIRLSEYHSRTHSEWSCDSPPTCAQGFQARQERNPEVARLIPSVHATLASSPPRISKRCSGMLHIFDVDHSRKYY